MASYRPFALSLALVSAAAAQASYAAGQTTIASATYACNPAHEQCATVSGSLIPASSTFACNPAHEACATVSGSLVPATTSATYACNPAHEQCATVSGSLVPASSTFACNPAHEACATVSGSLVPAAAATSSSAFTTYACNPAHQYPGGARCISSAGALTLVTPSASQSAVNSVDVPEYRTQTSGTAAPTGAMGGSGNATAPNGITPYTGAGVRVGTVGVLAAAAAAGALVVLTL